MTLRDVFAARDPAHRRLIAAVAVTAGMLMSALFGQFVVHELHAEAGLLAMSIFLSVQAGSMVTDASAAARVVTTALLIPTVVVAITVATTLSSHRPLVVGGFVIVTGAAIWVRKFGPRAAAIGSLGFMGYFFALFMKPTAAELPAFCLVAAAAVVAQLIVRAVLMLKRPRRELEVLLRELRAGSAVAIRAARRASPAANRTRTLRNALARLDDVGRAISDWQREFRTAAHIAADEQTLAERVLDARVDTEQACLELARRPAPPSTSAATRAERALFIVLDERATSSRVHAARAMGAEILERHQRRVVDLGAYLVARSTISHARLRDIDLSHGLDDGTDRARRVAPTSPGPADGRGTSEAATAHDTTRVGRAHWHPTPWRSWAPTSRMAVQAMIAALIATGVGEAISASRWYWAVMTAFVVFIGATSRSGILTRAYRRVVGTIIGICAGVAVVALAGSDTGMLVAICVVAVFGMLYFGPLNYLYSSAFITTMLVVLYRMLGVLDDSILELRLIETGCGAVIGVLCAYLILSANSRPALAAKIDAFFAALDKLLAASTSAPLDPSALMRMLHELESAQADLDRAVASMSTAFLIGKPGKPHPEHDAVHLMYVAGRAAARLVQAVLARAASRSRGNAAGSAAIVDAVEQVARTAAAARGALVGGRSPDAVDASASAPLVIDELRDLSTSDESARDAILALARIEWALRRLADGDEPARRPRARATADGVRT